MDKATNIKNLREVPVTKLVKADWNYKEDDEFRGEQLRRNLFNSNLVKLSQVIAEIRKEFTIEDLQETMPFHAEEFEAFSEMGKFDWNDGKEIKPDTDGGLPADKVKLEFLLTKAQAKVVNKALIRIISEMEIEGEYRMSRALELIAADSLNTPIENFK